ncbi:MAG: FecR family protein [Cyclobacteriaceae bacterium]|nr:FecR family protein [Cyclobacteriaceae bacterium]
MQDNNFDRLLQRYLHNELTPEESAKFSAWLELLEKENDIDLELSPQAKERLFKTITNRLNTAEDVVALYPRKSSIATIFRHTWVQVAASVLLLIGATYLVSFYLNQQQGGDAFTQNEKMILNDGTIVWLTEPGDLLYYENDTGRFATFTGHGLFEVAKDATKPFIISCGAINVRVVGTSFTLRSDTTQIELNVFTGKVHVASAADRQGVDVLPNQRIVYTGTGLVEQSTISAEQVAAVTGNAEYNLRFQSASMQKVITGIEKKFNIKITLTNKNINKCHVSADFTDHSLEDTLSILTDLLNINYQLSPGKVELSGEGC